MKKVAILPFRSNSTRFKGKNFASICGVPLYLFVCKKIVNSNVFDEVVLFTDEFDRVSTECRELPVKVIERDKINSDALSPSEDVMKEAVEKLQLSGSDWLVLFQVTNPFVETKYLKELEELISNEDFSSVFTCVKNNRFDVETVSSASFSRPRTQDMENKFIETGLFWAILVSEFTKIGKRISNNAATIEIEKRDDIDIDYEEEFLDIRHRLEKEVLREKNHHKIRKIDRSKINNYYDNPLDPDGIERDILSDIQGRLDFAKDEIEYFNSLLRKRDHFENINVLDIGCGAGVISENIFKGRGKITGIEVSAAACEIAKKRLDEVKCGFYEQFEKDFNANSFDYIIAFHVIEHVDNPNHFLDFCYKILKPGGLILLSTPDFNGPIAKRFGSNFRLLHDPTHQSLFSMVGLLNAVQARNFKLHEILTPFLGTKFMTEENVLAAIGDTDKMSPAFVGNVISLFLEK